MRKQALCIFVLLTLLTQTVVKATPRWILTYSRQYGEALTGGVAGQAELFAHYESGVPAQIGMTNDWNSNFAIFGKTGTFGNSRITFDINNRVYDFHVFDPAVPSDRSPDCFWLDSLPHYGHYRFEFHWRKISNPELITSFPEKPAYHYDLVQGFNTGAGAEAPNFNSDSYSLSDWKNYQAQTFVVPEGQNRIIAAKAFCVREHMQVFRMKATIREGGPLGPQVGPASISREVFSNEFPNVLMSWGIDSVPVVPGKTYALRLEAVDAGGFNVYATNNNTYSPGILYNGTTAVPGRDMIAVVVGLGVNIETDPQFIRGDSNDDHSIDLADAITILQYLFSDGSSNCLESFDSNNDERIDLADAVFLLSYLFTASDSPENPFPECGVEENPEESSLGCELSSCP